MREDAAHNDDAVSSASEGNAKALFAEPIKIFPGIVEDVDAMVRRFGDHIVDFTLISNGGEMEAARAQDRAF
jgi:hypothetical protein